MEMQFEVVKPEPVTGNKAYKAPFISISAKDVIALSQSARKTLGVEQGGRVVIIKDRASNHYYIGNGKGFSPNFQVQKSGNLRNDLLLPSKLRQAYNLPEDDRSRLYLSPQPLKYEHTDLFELKKKKK